MRDTNYAIMSSSLRSNLGEGELQYEEKSADSSEHALLIGNG